jgi:hypothetical protein
MAVFRHAKVVEVVEELADLVRLRVVTDIGELEAVGFVSMLGPVAPSDRVVVNTTGIELELGTGGTAFALWNLDGPGAEVPGEGHIVKLRYTPWQMNVLAAEAPESRHHEQLRDVESISGMPVVACGLHSQIAGVCAGIKAARPDARVAYLMTDGGALPLAWSRLVTDLRRAALLDATATCGHAFGGDLETINVFSGLAALHSVAGADVVVAAMGPGVVGTSTRLGFSAIEQGQVLDAAGALEGEAIACLRISFDDPRQRHQGISHHALTALRLAARDRCAVAVPLLPDEQARLVDDQLRAQGVANRHDLVVADGRPALRLLVERGLALSSTSMGRTIEQAPQLWLAAGAAGALASSLLEDGSPS